MRKLGAWLLVILLAVHVAVGMPRVVQEELELAREIGARSYGNMLVDLALLIGIGWLGSFLVSTIVAGLAGIGYWAMTFVMTDVATSNMRPGTFYAAREAVRISDSLELLAPRYLVLAAIMLAIWLITRRTRPNTSPIG